MTIGRRIGLSPARPAALGVLLLSLAIAGCTTPRPDLPMRPPVAGPGQTQPGPIGPQPYPYYPPATDSPAALPGWAAEDHLAAFNAYTDGCRINRTPEGAAACARAQTIRQTSRPVTPDQARSFFEQSFRMVEARTPNGAAGLMTAYFAPEYPARRRPGGEFDMPVLAKPADLERSGSTVVQRRRDGSTGPYADRAAIEAAAAAGTPSAPVLAWMKAEDLFFLQIQGSGYLTFEDGSTGRAAYAADNGRPFVGIARPMADQGLLPQNGTSGDAIRTWLAEHRGREARAITALNPRYIFFDLQADDGGHPGGAAGVPLTAGRAIAVDPAHWTYGDLVWIQADAGNLAGARRGYQGLVMALDTGSAIRGPVRADFYMGRGEAAGSEAGTVRHPLRMWKLVPR